MPAPPVAVDGSGPKVPVGVVPLIEWPVIHAVGWLLITAATLIAAGLSWLNLEARAAALTGPLLEISIDSTPFLAVLLVAPVVWFSGNRRTLVKPVSPSESSRWTSVDALLAVAIGVLGMLASRWFGLPFDGLPPAIHDEYSYLFQARTFLEGRTWLPGFPEHPELFNQMHVLNEGRFASRYFPGTGAWLAPFVWLGNPWEGQWLANGVVAAGLFVVGRMLSGRFVGIVAGLLAVASPGLLVFSNMLVAHMPTLVGLTLFLWAILACRQRTSAVLALLAGTGLGFAMLCRPMTAAGFALPFGVDWLWRLWAARRTEAAAANLKSGQAKVAARPTLLQTLALGFPLVAGMGVMLAYNASITGHPLMSPYQLYNDIYTPSHVYGFNNAVRGRQQRGPKVIEHYDDWALNLTPRLSVENFGSRVTNSLRWTLGIVPLLIALAVILVDWKRLSASWRLIAAAIVSLHVAHLPYWYDGIMGWHYVFETGPLVLLLFAWATARLCSIWRAWGAGRLCFWWAGLVGVALLVNDVTISPLWRSRVAVAQSEAMFARGRLGLFRAEAGEFAAAGPIIVFVKPDPSDRHLDYVTNPPTLDGPVLVARSGAHISAAEVARLFPGRRAFQFDAASRQWSTFAPQ